MYKNCETEIFKKVIAINLILAVNNIFDIAIENRTSYICFSINFPHLIIAQAQVKNPNKIAAKPDGKFPKMKTTQLSRIINPQLVNKLNLTRRSSRG